MCAQGQLKNKPEKTKIQVDNETPLDIRKTKYHLKVRNNFRRTEIH